MNGLFTAKATLFNAQKSEKLTSGSYSRLRRPSRRRRLPPRRWSLALKDTNASVCPKKKKKKLQGSAQTQRRRPNFLTPARLGLKGHTGGEVGDDHFEARTQEDGLR